MPAEVSESIPVTIWVDEEAKMPIKIEIDKTMFMQAQEGQSLKSFITTYTLIESGEKVTVEVPKGI